MQMNLVSTYFLLLLIIGCSDLGNADEIKLKYQKSVYSERLEELVYLEENVKQLKRYKNQKDIINVSFEIYAECLALLHYDSFIKLKIESEVIFEKYLITPNNENEALEDFYQDQIEDFISAIDSKVKAKCENELRDYVNLTYRYFPEPLIIDGLKLE